MERVDFKFEFIRFHLHYQSSIQKNIYRLLTKVVDDESHETHLAEYSINGCRDLENLELGCEIQQIYNPYQSHAPDTKLMLVGSCNGLLCQSLFHGGIYCEYEISLCNPLTKASRVLHKSPLFLKDGSRRRRAVFYGFGHDDVHDTYKVFLGSAPHHNEIEYGLDAKYEYEVYSLRSNKWIIVRSDLDFQDYTIYCPRWNLDGVLINCALHWIFRNPFGPDQNKKTNYILAFDLRVDKLNILPLPEAAEEFHDLSLNVLNGCLLLSDQVVCFKPESTVEMWVLKDYGLKDSWTRINIRNSPYDLYSITPVALLEDNHQRKLIYHDHRRRGSRGMILLSYDIESHQVVEFPTPPSMDYFHSPKELQFVDSLVQPHPPSFPFGDKRVKEDNG